ncbi:hypothetical protein M501DRAFT_1019107 [Patellaria atrata CBS 101060]|uniref:Lipocalin-like domain-containing protein n=1 Tax=Patellaria atrata CBS 101060 TaxID=1346257 RepID=A0A9P4S4Z1_9PEZI|nr:hypothetical protein M501DRAFT_1019107 [Patellaria atrata CBS 101060]
MAAPPEKTIRDLNGVWHMNTTLSDSTEQIFVIQGLSWLLRKAISLADVTLTISHYLDNTQTPHIDIQQTLTGGLKGSPENRVLDWQWRPHSDIIFGELRGKSRYLEPTSLCLEDPEEKFLREGWEEGEKVEVMESYVENEVGGWVARQMWGFEKVGEERRYTRHVVVKKMDGSELEKARLVYDWISQS